MRILDVFREKTCLHTPCFPLASFHKCASALKIVVMRAGSLKAEFGFEVSIQVLALANKQEGKKGSISFPRASIQR